MLFLMLFSFTVVSASFLPTLMSIQMQLLIVIIFSVSAFKFKNFSLLAIPLGVVYATWAGHSFLENQIPDTLDRADVLVKGQLIGLPAVKGTTTRFEMLVIQAANYKDERLPTDSLVGKRISVSYNSRYNAKHPMEDEAFRPGQLLQLRLKLRKPRGFVNPVGFDYHLYLLRKGLSATAYVKSDVLNQTLAKSISPTLALKRDLIRYRLRGFVKQHAQYYPQTAGALLALISGDKQLMQDSEWDLFQATGTIHLMVISGLHVGLLAFIGFTLGRVIVKGLALLFRMKNQISLLLFPSLLSIGFSSIYAGIADFGLPTQRALVMVCVFHLFYCLQMKNRSWLGFILALAVVLIIDPLAAHTPGFWLSFGAVGILLFSFQGYQHINEASIVKRTVFQWLRSQWVLCIGLGVPSIVLIGGFSGSGFVSNFIAIPLVSFIIVPLSLLSAVLVFIFEPAAIWVLHIAQLFMAALLWCLAAINETLPSFIQYHNALPIVVIILAIVGVAYWLAPSLAYRYIALLSFLPILFTHTPQVFLRVTFLDVGQGTAIVIETKHHQMVYDAGKKYSEQFDSGADIVAPYLSSLSYQAIDAVMISHGDNDHAGGLAGLLETINTKHLFVGETDKNFGEQCLAGEQWQWDGISFEVLWPSKEYVEAMQLKPVYYKSNNISCVLLIRAGDKSVLLAGDIDRSIERRLLNTLQKEQGIDVVLAPHHGSKTSSSTDWVEALQPNYVVFTAGFRNAYGHPHPTVVERYHNANTQILNTAKDGAIRFSLAGFDSVWQLERWRDDYQRYWH